MTKIKINTTPQRIRSAIAELLTDFAHDKGLESVGPPGRKGRDTRVSADSALKKLPQLQPDLTLLDGRRLLWKFHILPSSRKLRRLHPALTAVSNAVVCSDSSDNLALIDPLRLLDFLAKSAPSRKKPEIQSVMTNSPSLSIPPPDYHFKGIIQKNHQFVKDHFSLRIRTRLAPRPAPGQFLQLMCDPAPHNQSPKYRCHTVSDRGWPKLRGMELTAKHPFLRRPFSVASYGPPTGHDDIIKNRLFGAGWMQTIDWVEPEFEIIYRRHPGGAGTGALAQRHVGETIDVVGPLGKGFTGVPRPEVAILVGGGIGAPPLLFLAEELSRAGVETKIFLGALSKSKIPFQLRGAPDHRITRFEGFGLHPVICTDDGSVGYHGLVTGALVEYLEKECDPALRTKIYACGPRSMLTALNGIANRYNLPCEVLLEETMACGFGACISCVCAVKETGQKARFTRICTEGPAIDSKMVMWHG